MSAGVIQNKTKLLEMCPRCGASEARTLHTMITTNWTAECACCGFGYSEGPNEETVMARLHGRILARNEVYKTETENNPQTPNEHH